MPVVMAVGGLFALMGAFMASRLAEEKDEIPQQVAEGRRTRPRRPVSRSASFGGTALEY